jgi:enoyl-CoA hydratase/carnithine racemase
VDAAEALRIGLANRVSAPGKCVAEALESARVIASHAPEIVRQIKTCIGILAADGLGAADRFEQASAGRQPKGEEAVRIFEARISGLGKGTKGA